MPSTSSPNRIHTNLVMMYGVFSIVILTITSFQSYLGREDTLSDYRNMLSNYSAITEEALNSALQRVDSALYQVALEISETPRKLKPEYRKTLLLQKKLLKDIPELDFRVSSADGDLVASTGEAHFKSKDLNTSSANRDFFIKLKNAGAPESYLSGPTKAVARENRTIVVLGRRISSKRGQLLGVVSAAVDVEFFARIVKKVVVDDSSSFLVASGDDRTIIFRQPPRAGIVGTQVERQASFGSIAYGDKKNGLTEGPSSKDGKVRISSATWVGDFALFVAHSADKSKVLAQWYKSVFITFAVIILMLSIGWVFLLRHIKNGKLIFNQQAHLASTARLVALGEMAGGVAHQINTPLASILMATERIRSVASGEADSINRLSEVKEFSELVIETTSQIAKIISGLRNFARDGRNDSFVTTNVADIIEQVLALSSERFNSVGVALTFNRPLGPLLAPCRAAEIGQALVNLLHNSGDAISSTKGGWVKLSLEETEAEIRIKVIDSGSGIPKAIADHMFEPFFTTKAPGRGTGLGLSVSHGIIQRHGGRLVLDHTASNTTFVICLPKKSSGEVAA
jgi:signal transduction histidine kinase